MAKFLAADRPQKPQPVAIARFLGWTEVYGGRARSRYPEVTDSRTLNTWDGAVKFAANSKEFLDPRTMVRRKLRRLWTRGRSRCAGHGTWEAAERALFADRRKTAQPVEIARSRDGAAFIVSANLARRNLNKSQQAMALAMIYPEPNKSGKADPFKNLNGSDRVMLSQARTILRNSQELAYDVLHRGMHFDVALREVREAEQNRKSHRDQSLRLARSSEKRCVLSVLSLRSRCRSHGRRGQIYVPAAFLRSARAVSSQPMQTERKADICAFRPPGFFRKRCLM
jgi:hypothetical protein